MPSLSLVFERAVEAYEGPATDTSWAIMIFARLGSTTKPAPTDREIEAEQIKPRRAAELIRKEQERRLGRTRDRRYRATQGFSVKVSREKAPI
jgi:hypothetical protein